MSMIRDLRIIYGPQEECVEDCVNHHLTICREQKRDMRR
jgi:hypothetical protein